MITSNGLRFACTFDLVECYSSFCRSKNYNFSYILLGVSMMRGKVLLVCSFLVRDSRLKTYQVEMFLPSWMGLLSFPSQQARPLTLDFLHIKHHSSSQRCVPSATSLFSASHTFVRQCLGCLPVPVQSIQSSLPFNPICTFKPLNTNLANFDTPREFLASTWWIRMTATCLKQK